MSYFASSSSYSNTFLVSAFTMSQKYSFIHSLIHTSAGKGEREGKLPLEPWFKDQKFTSSNKNSEDNLEKFLLFPVLSIPRLMNGRSPHSLFWNVVLNLWEVVVYERWSHMVVLLCLLVCCCCLLFANKIAQNTDEGSDPENKLGDVFILFSV